MWLNELGLGVEFGEIVHAYANFFSASRRREKLKSLVESDDTPGMIRLKMLAVCAAADPRI